MDEENNSAHAAAPQKPNYWKYGFFLNVLLLILLLAYIVYREANATSKINTVREQIPQEKIITVYPTESPDDLKERCGDIPMSILSIKKNFDHIEGPVWSPDCRHIAWSIWESGTSYGGDDPEVINQLKNSPPRKLTGREGVFIYTDASKTTEKIYTPVNIDETPEFIQWKDKNTVLFKAQSIDYSYSLIQKKYTKISSSTSSASSSSTPKE